MRAVRALTGGLVGSAGQPWLPGLPHAVAGLATWLAFGGLTCVIGLLLTTVASFVVYLPLTALALNGGRALEPDAPAPVLPPRAQAVLFGLWTLTAWATAGLTYAAS